MSGTHEPVLQSVVLEHLRPSPGARVVDGTLGLGGHAAALLSRVRPGGQLIGLDRDARMLARAEGRLRELGDGFVTVRARLSYVADVVRGLNLAPVQGILFDLGLCSAQLDDPERGFSFQASDAPLDMRMDQSHGQTASELLEGLEPAELERILRAGDVPHPRRVASALLASRPLRTVGELRGLLQDLHLPRRRHHFATLVFQALRMEVNQELREVELALEAALDVLAPGGRLAVLSYHSGEDRRVKRFFAREARGCVCPPSLPACGCGRLPRIRICVRGQTADPDEVRDNPRARSARLRVAEML